MKRILITVLAFAMVSAAAVVVAFGRDPGPIRIGAIYPVSGPQSPGGIAEFRGVQLAAEMINASEA